VDVQPFTDHVHASEMVAHPQYVTGFLGWHCAGGGK
jgi:hypothetical protein